MKYFCDDPELDQLYKKHADDAGFDICAAEDIEVNCSDRVLVSTKLHVAIPSGYVGILKPRSGLSIDYGTNIGAGVIDASYRGEIKVVLTAQTFPFVIHKNDRIAQMLILKLPQIEPIKVSSLEELGDTERGENGFGSTGGY